MMKAGEHGENYHPTQKPVAVMEWCLTKLPPGLLVLDPYMGSGSTLVAAKRLGIRAVGIELDGGYCAIAARRCAAARYQPTLPTMDAPQPQEQIGRASCRERG